MIKKLIMMMLVLTVNIFSNNFTLENLENLKKIKVEELNKFEERIFLSEDLKTFADVSYTSMRKTEIEERKLFVNNQLLEVEIFENVRGLIKKNYKKYNEKREEIVKKYFENNVLLYEYIKDENVEKTFSKSFDEFNNRFYLDEINVESENIILMISYQFFNNKRLSIAFKDKKNNKNYFEISFNSKNKEDDTIYLDELDLKTENIALEKIKEIINDLNYESINKDFDLESFRKKWIEKLALEKPTNFSYIENLDYKVNVYFDNQKYYRINNEQKKVYVYEL